MKTPRRKPAVQPDPIAERGEHELALAGTTYRLRPAHNAIVAIEKKTDHSLLALVRLGNSGDLTMVQLGVIVAELIRAGAADELTRHVNADAIQEMIFEEGVPAVTSRVTLCLLDAATGGRTRLGEAKAATA